MTLRKRIYQLLEEDHGTDDFNSESISKDNHCERIDKIGSCIDYFLMMLIALNVSAAVLETLTYFKPYKTYFNYFEIVSVIIFTIEYILRVWVRAEEPKPHYLKKDISNARKRIRYIFSPMAIVDFIAIAPFYLSFFFVMDLRFLRILRIMRIFKLTRYSESMTLLLKILRRESQSLASSFFILLVIMVIAASAIFLIEHDVQPEQFSSIPATMWWAIVTLTTVGYGDVYPITIGGKLFASLIMIAGIGLVALPTAILASSFSSTLANSREKLTIELHKMLDDHEIDEQEQAALEKLRKKLGLSERELYEIQQSVEEKKKDEREKAKKEEAKKCFCPHCGGKL